MEPYTYIGNELILAEDVVNWKKYFFSKLKPYIGESVLEIGAGLGSTTQILCTGSQKSWVCLEPDKNLFTLIKNKIENKILPECCDARCGFTKEIPKNEKFDTLLYVDVIEHIEFDKEELMQSTGNLTSGGNLIILVPAFQFLFNTFDLNVGHFRRYNKKRLTQSIPDNFIFCKMQYLDSCGFFTSVFNKFFLKSKLPSKTQFLFWDRILIRISKFLDPLLCYSFGKSLIGVWRKK